MKLQYSACRYGMAFVTHEERRKTRHRHAVSVELFVGHVVIKYEFGHALSSNQTCDVLFAES